MALAVLLRTIPLPQLPRLGRGGLSPARHGDARRPQQLRRAPPSAARPFGSLMPLVSPFATIFTPPPPGPGSGERPGRAVRLPVRAARLRQPGGARSCGRLRLDALPGARLQRRLLTDAPALPAVLAAMWLFERGRTRDDALAGVLFGVAILTRYTLNLLRPVLPAGGADSAAALAQHACVRSGDADHTRPLPLLEPAPLR
ncbi:MAG: hypothetical protein MZW92_47015 [Comamonadaceae bacterium]|nr:hypothetical protein [Comamonadaceae bacterium]